MADNNNSNQENEQQAQVAQVSDELFDLAAVFKDKPLDKVRDPGADNNIAQGQSTTPESNQQHDSHAQDQEDFSQSEQAEVQSDSPSIVTENENSTNLSPESQVESAQVPIESDETPAQFKKEKYGDDTSLAIENNGHDDLFHVRNPDASRPDSVKRDLGIGDQVSPIEFDIETHIVVVPQQEVPVCLPPEGTISYQEFLDQVQNEIIDQDSPFQLDTEFSVSIEISSYEQFRDAITVIDQTGFNSDSVAQEFTFFLGENTLLFDEQVNVDFGVDTLNILGCGCSESFLDGLGDSRILNLESGNVNVDSVTFKNGFVESPANPDIDDTADIAGNGGGAIVVQHDVVFNSYNSCYENNQAFFGGAIANAGGHIENIENNIFKYNSGDAAGGAIYNAFFINFDDPLDVNYAQLDNVSNTKFFNNHSDGFDVEAVLLDGNIQLIPQAGRGGAIANLGNLTSILGSEFESNTVMGQGGAIYNGFNIPLAISLGTPTGIYQIRDSSFDHNKALNTAPIDNQLGELVRIDGEGGAIYNFGSNEGDAIITILEANFNQNHAEHIGGGFYNSGAVGNDGRVDGFAALAGIYSTFTKNSADVLGGGIFNTGDLSFAFITSEFISNTAGIAGGGFYAAGLVGTGAGPNPGIIGSTFQSNSAGIGAGMYIGNIDVDQDAFEELNVNGYFTDVIVNENNYVDNIRYSAFIDNTAAIGGGAIAIDGDNAGDGDATVLRLIENTTISGNQAPIGTAISVVGAEIGLINFSTITHNIETVYPLELEEGEEIPEGWLGSTIFIIEGGSSINIGNSIVAINAGEDLVGTGFTSDGFNIVGDFGFSDYTQGPGGFSGPNVDILNLPELQTLMTGNPTLLELNGTSIPVAQFGDFLYTPYYHPLASNSAAIDNANPIWTDFMTDTDGDGILDEIRFDQRIFNRPIDGDGDGVPLADIGAIEFGSTLAFQVPVIAPIVFDLDNNGIELISSAHSAITVQNDSGLHQLGWVSGEDGILVYDINQDGIVNSLGEIALSRYHPDAITDLHGLQLAFDSNQDNVFNHMDKTFAHFGVWQDINENGVTEEGEFKTLVEAGVEAIELDAVESVEWNADNIVFAEGTVVMTDGTEQIFGDVALTMEDVSSADSITFIDDGLPASFDGAVAQQEEALVEVVDPLVNFTIDESTQIDMAV